MTTQLDNQRMKLNSHMLLLATWLWILAGTLSVGIIGGRSVIPADEYARPWYFVIPFTLGGIIGGIIARFLHCVIKRGKIGYVLSLILPILLIISIISQVVELGVLLIFSILGILGSSYIVWIPRWTRRLWKEKNGAWWVVVFALALVVLNTFCILAIFFSTAFMSS
jgi:hypothetical protein